MLDKILKMLPLAMGPLVTCASVLSAASLDSRIDELEDKISALSEKNVQGSIGGKNPSTHTERCGYGVFVTGDALFWKATQDGLEYAIDIPVASSLPPVQQNGKVKDLNFKWGWGFRAGIGYNLPYDGWDLYLNWTRFHHTSSSHIERASGGTLEPLWLPPTYTFSNNVFANTAAARWRLQYDTLDLELGRSYFVSRALALRPFIGLRGAFIHQSIRYQFTPQSFNFFNPFTTKGRNNFNAFGLRAGVALNWFFNSQWSLFGNASATLAQGEFDVALKMSAKRENPLRDAGNLLREKNSYHRVKTNLEAAVGLTWETYFCSKRYHVALSLAYEVVQWINQNQLREAFFPQNFLGTFVPHHGDLGLHGGTFAARFDF